ncbi:hypothetical protein CDAR_204431 [Caerostris darwini]|uniref:SHSP domain-containing protein n=1 Tax=Caerostris darwini TaxID=1538125 RepID=A0AAV4QEK6_9ARAC|nr:hypothetical protein CDAR_204431 [Caerostris darwini]
MFIDCRAIWITILLRLPIYIYTSSHDGKLCLPTHVHFHTMKLRRPTSLTSKNAVSGKGKNSFQVMLNASTSYQKKLKEFTRRYQVPDDVDPKTVISSLSKEGVLTVHAPRKRMEPPKNERESFYYHSEASSCRRSSKTTAKF